MSHTAKLLNPRLRHLPQWSGNSCALIGTDGLDLCVSINLVFFYTYLGFDVFFADAPVPADLMVLMRYPGDDVEEFGQKFHAAARPDTPVHIYSYVGIAAQRVIKSLGTNPITHFAPSDKLLVEPAPNLTQHVAFPPVFPEFWARPPAEREYIIAHIGNCKSKGVAMESWKDEQDLIQALRDPRSHVWGRPDWSEIPGIANWHGELKIVHVPQTYARTKYALGLMYPFQQQTRTFSSRFWQAPLCGAALIVEKQTWQLFPGIYPLGLDDIGTKIEKVRESPEEIYRAAVDYWLRAREKTADLVCSALKRSPPAGSNVKASHKVWIEDPILSIASGGIGPEFAFRAVGREGA